MPVKALIPLSLTVLAVLPVRADEIHYAYDQSGRRTSREMTISIAPPTPMTSPAAKSSIFDSLGDISVVYYPNPTPGMLRVEISGLPDNPVGIISVVSMSGSTVREEELAPMVEIDLTDLPKGLYILTLSHSGRAMTYKIIKE